MKNATKNTGQQAAPRAKKHHHIWILLESGVCHKNVMHLAHCNPGEIQNVKRMYKNKSRVMQARKALCAA